MTFGLVSLVKWTQKWGCVLLLFLGVKFTIFGWWVTKQAMKSYELAFDWDQNSTQRTLATTHKTLLKRKVQLSHNLITFIPWQM